MRLDRRRRDQALDRIGSTHPTVAKDPAQHLARHLRGVALPARALHHDDRDGDARRLGRRDADEPLVAARRIRAREASRLARHLHGPEQRPAAAGAEGAARRPERGGVDQHVPQLAGQLGREHLARRRRRGQRELAPGGVDDAVDPARLDHLAEGERARELRGMQRRDAAAREAAAELAHAETVVRIVDDPGGMTRRGLVRPAEARDGSQQRLDADRVHRELRQALVVRGRERLLQRHDVAAPRRIDARRGEAVGAPREAAGKPRGGGVGAERRGGRDHLHERRRGVGARRGKLLGVGRRIGEHATGRGIQHDHVAERDLAVREHLEDAARQLGVEAVLDPQRPIPARDVDDLEQALGSARRRAPSWRWAARAPRATRAGASGSRPALRPRASPRALRSLRALRVFRWLRSLGRFGRLGGDLRERGAVEAAGADARGEPETAGEARQHADRERCERDAPALREPSPQTLVAPPAGAPRADDPARSGRNDRSAAHARRSQTTHATRLVQLPPVHSATSSSVAPNLPGGRGSSASSAGRGRSWRARSHVL